MNRRYNFFNIFKITSFISLFLSAAFLSIHKDSTLSLINFWFYLIDLAKTNATQITLFFDNEKFLSSKWSSPAGDCKRGLFLPGFFCSHLTDFRLHFQQQKFTEFNFNKRGAKENPII